VCKNLFIATPIVDNFIITAAAAAACLAFFCHFWLFYALFLFFVEFLKISYPQLAMPSVSALKYLNKNCSL